MSAGYVNRLANVKTLPSAPVVRKGRGRDGLRGEDGKYLSTAVGDARRKAQFRGEPGAAAASLLHRPKKKPWDYNRDQVTDASGSLARKEKKVRLGAVKEEMVQRTLPDCARYSAIGKTKPVPKGRTVLSLAGWEEHEVAWLGPILCRSVLGKPGAFVLGARCDAEEAVPDLLLKAGFAPEDVERLRPWLEAEGEVRSVGGRPAGISK